MDRVTLNTFGGKTVRQRTNIPVNNVTDYNVWSYNQATTKRRSLLFIMFTVCALNKKYF